MAHRPSQMTSETRHAIILAAGESKRTRPLTLQRPKPLIALAGQPLLAHILDEMVGLVERVTLVVGYRADAVRAHFGDSYRGMQVRYIHQHQVNGTAGALLAVAEHDAAHESPYRTGPFFLLYGDNLISQVDLLNASQQRYCVAGLPVAEPSSFGILDVVHGRLRRIIEKPPDAPPGSLANLGIYHLDTDVFPALQTIEPSPRGEYELTDLIALLARQHAVGYSECVGHWIPVGNPWDALLATLFLLQQRHALRPALDPTAQVAPDCQIDGYAAIGPEAQIGAGCHLVGPVQIGAGAQIGPGCVIQRTVLEAGVEVGARCTLDSSVLGAGAQVGENCALQYSLLDNAAALAAGTRLLASTFTQITPVAEVRGLLDRETLCRRGVVVGQGAVISTQSSHPPGSVIFPDAHSAS